LQWIAINQVVAPYLAALNVGKYFFLSLTWIVQLFTSEIPVLMREHGNGLYSVDTYYMAKTIAEIPLDLIMPSILFIILYVNLILIFLLF